MWKYASFLEPIAEEYRVKLGEGNTPLVKSMAIGPSMGLNNLYFKLENLNPTGSYKDRFAAMFVSMMKSKGQQLCVATSSGNTGAALSAYCAAAGLKCVLVIVDGAPVPKIKQMQLYGAHTIMINDFGKNPTVTSAVFEALNNFTSSKGLPLPVSAYAYCKEGMKGVQTIAYEILDDLAADHIFVPAGGGGLTLAIASGVLEYQEKGLAKKAAVHCVQPEGNDTIAGALRRGDTKTFPVVKSTTTISGLQVPSILDGDQVLQACKAIGGNGYIVSDQSVFEFHKILAQQEGIFSEPAGVVSLAGLAVAVKNKEVESDDKVVCLITGSGFKDLVSVDNHFNLPDIQKFESQSMLQLIQSI